MTTTEEQIAAIRASVPNLKTQAQLTAYLASFDALRCLLNAIYGNDTEQEKLALKAFDQAVELARKSTALGAKIDEVPLEQRGEASAAFVDPPSVENSRDYDAFKELTLSLNDISSRAGLNQWYEDTKERRAHVTSKHLRDSLIDAIRKKGISLQ